ncbi:MAG: methionyl-tRNA formyltransferase [Alphaproteobacteria bacterium]|nr:methionyl-tRNA formyltransferase [Alphaproteobacteria bacterium]
MRLAFMGSPEFAVPALIAILEAGHEIACVYSQPPRPAGRGKADRKTAVHLAAEARGLEVRTPLNFKGEEDRARFAALSLDAAVVVAYGLLLPRAILDAPKAGCFNLHGSLLPRWRGAAPIQRAVMAGDDETGVQVMKMEAGLDTGPVMLTARTPISPTDTTGDVHDRLSRLGAGLIVEALARIEDGSARLVPQPEEGVTYAAKILPEETRIDWSRPAREVSAHLRGLSPQPGAWFEWPGEKGEVRIKALNAVVEEGSGAPGELLDERLLVACGTGAVRLTRLQRAGKGPMNADAFLRGAPAPAGRRLR